MVVFGQAIYIISNGVYTVINVTSQMTTREARPGTYKKTLMAFCGAPLVGKSSLAKAIGQNLKIKVLDLDDMRLELFNRPGERLPDQQEREVMLSVYIEMYKRARATLYEDRPVITVATHSRPIYHELLRTSAQYAEAAIALMYSDTSKIIDLDAFLTQRIASRVTNGDSSSNVTDLAYAKLIVQRYKCITPKDGETVIVTDPTKSREALSEETTTRVYDLLRK